jgi:hypothetical protein
MNRYLRICIIAGFLLAFGTPPAHKADVNISVGKLHFGLTKATLNGKIDAR